MILRQRETNLRFERISISTASVSMEQYFARIPRREDEKDSSEDEEFFK